jgi:hypothetical protein
LSPTADTVQAVFDYIDAEGVGGSGGYGTNTYVNPSTWQYLLETPTTPTGGIVSGLYLPGTNIVGATYSDAQSQWSITWSDILNAYPFLDTDYRNDGTGATTSVVQGAVFRAYVPPGDYSSSTTNFTNNVVVFDSASAWNPTSQAYTVQSSGYYLLGLTYSGTSSVSANYEGPWYNAPNTLPITISFLANSTSTVLQFSRGAVDETAERNKLDPSGSAPVFLTSGDNIAISKDSSSTGSLAMNMNWFISAIGGGGGSEYVVDAVWTNSLSFSWTTLVLSNIPFNSGWLDFNPSTLFNKDTGVFSPQTNKAYIVEHGASFYFYNSSQAGVFSAVSKNNAFPSSAITATNTISSAGDWTTPGNSRQMALVAQNSFYIPVGSLTSDYYKVGMMVESLNTASGKFENAYFRVREVTP